jgi:hypothetical protein
MTKTNNTNMKNFQLSTFNFQLFTLLLAGVFAFAGCNKEDDESLFAGSDNAIAAFALVKDGITLHGAVSPNTIVITAPERFSLEGAVSTVTLSENAAIAPDPSAITDWNAAHTFTVTAYSGATHTYAYSVERHFVSREGDVVLLTQTDVDAFAEAVQGIDQINGSITIGAASGQDSIYSLAGLEHLRVITSGIIINSTWAGEDLTVFESLERTGELRIASTKVKTVRFPRLVAVHGELNIDQTTAVRTLDFPELTMVDKSLRIYYADSLASMNFPVLQQVVESVTVQGRSSGTQNLQAIAFPALQKVSGSFTLSYWREVTTVHIPELAVVGGALNITSLTKVAAFAAPGLEAAGGLALSSCAALASADFSALKTATGNITFSACNVLAAVDFDALTTVTGNLSPNLTALAEVNFPKLETVTGALSFATSATLTALQFPTLKSAGSLTIPNAANLTTLHFPALKTVTGELSVQLYKLTSLDAFGSVETVGERLYLNNLPGLTSLAGLSSLMSAGTVYASGLTDVTEIDVRRWEVASWELYGSTLTGLTLTGDPDFPGRLYFGNAAPPVIVQGIENVGELVVAAGGLAALELPWLKKVSRLLNISGNNLTSISLPNLRSAGKVTLSGSTNMEALSLPELETVTGYTSGTVTGGGFTFSPYDSGGKLEEIVLPKLKSIVGNLEHWNIIHVATISYPALRSIKGTLDLRGAWGVDNFEDLSGFSTLTSVDGVTISSLPQLKNFEPLKQVIPGLTSATWRVTSCGYNPTYQQMVDGEYSN